MIVSNTEPYLDELKKIQMIVFEVFKDVCKKNNLRYFAIGGTCIGAIRHKGYIPWDDDIDVAMPYEDYKEFIRIFKKNAPQGFSIYDPHEHSLCMQEFIKIQYDNSTFIEKTDKSGKDIYMGINIDIMPVFGMPRGRVIQKIVALISELYTYNNRRLRMPYKWQKGTLAKIVWFCNGKRRSKGQYDYYLHRKELFLSRFPFQNSDRVLFGWRFGKGLLHPNNTYDSVFYTEDFANTIDMEFENSYIKVPIGYDRYLKMDFGDYMKMPPEEKRIPIHGSADIIFDIPFKTFLNEESEA